MDSCHGLQCLSHLFPQVQFPSASRSGTEIPDLLLRHPVYTRVRLLICSNTGSGQGLWLGNGMCLLLHGSQGFMLMVSQLWCWVATEWDFLRVATFYAPIWVVIAFTFSIYLWAGKEIFAKRRQLRNFDHAASDVTFPVIQNPFISPFVSVRTTEISVTTELPSRNRSYPKFALDESGCIISDTGFDAYSVVIGAGTKQDRTLAHSPALQRSSEFVGLKTDINVKHMQAAMQANEAAFSYCKCALLFFASLLVTWVPSSINRVYTLVYPHAYPFPLLFVAALVLPLQGLWNGLIYTATSLPECRALCSQLMEYWAPRKNKSLRPYPPIISQESLGSSRDTREGVPTGIREVV